MPNLNHCQFMGNLTRDPELKYTPKGTAVAQVGLAINKKYTTADGEKRETTTFLDFELWGKTAELAGEYLKKGSPVYFQAEAKVDSWEDKESGKKRSKVKFTVHEMQFIGKKQGGDEHEEQEHGSRPSQRTSRRPSPAKRPSPPPKDPDLDAVEDDDVPF